MEEGNGKANSQCSGESATVGHSVGKGGGEGVRKSFEGLVNRS